MINTERDRGGAAKMASTLVRAFNDAHADMNARLVHHGDKQISDEFLGLRRSWVTYAIAVQTRLFGSSRITDFGVSSKVLRQVESADIVHIHNAHGYYIDYLRLIAALRDKPVVWTWHDMWGATGRCGQSEDCERWKKACTPCPNLSFYPAAWIDNSGAEYARKFAVFAALRYLTIVCPSQWLAGVAAERGYSRDRIIVIPNPVDTKVFRCIDQLEARAALGLDKGRPIALFVAEDCGNPVKGYSDFCEATKALDCDAMAVGRPPDRVAGHVLHAGRIDNRETLAKYYAAADVMLIPSYAENLPNTVVESLVTGTPVIGYDVGGIPSQLTDDWSIVVPKGDKHALAQGLERLLRDVTRVRGISEQLARESRARWSSEQVMNAYREVYESLLDEKRSQKHP